MKTVLKVGLSNVCLSVSLPDMYGVKQADALSLVIFNFALQYATGKDRVNLERMKLNDTHQLLVSVDVNLLADCLLASSQHNLYDIYLLLCVQC